MSDNHVLTGGPTVSYLHSDEHIAREAVRLYRDEGMTFQVVARLLRRKDTTIRKWLAEAGVEMHPTGRKPTRLMEFYQRGYTIDRIARAVGKTPAETWRMIQAATQKQH